MDTLFKQFRSYTSNAFNVFSLVLWVLILLFYLLSIAYFPTSQYCESDTECLNGGTCDMQSHRCQCVKYAQYPKCDPVKKCQWESMGFGGISLAFFIFWYISTYLHYSRNVSAKKCHWTLLLMIFGFTGALFVVFMILLFTVDLRTDNNTCKTSVECLNGGECSLITGLCECELYSDYPRCDRAVSCFERGVQSIAVISCIVAVWIMVALLYCGNTGHEKEIPVILTKSRKNPGLFIACSLISLILLLVFMILFWVTPLPSYECIMNEDCGEFGVCDPVTKRCVCDEYVDMPYCVPVLHLQWTRVEYAVLSLIVFVVWTLSFFDYFCDYTVETKSLGKDL